MRGADLLLGEGQAAQADCILGAGMKIAPRGHMASKERGEEMQLGGLHWS